MLATAALTAVVAHSAGVTQLTGKTVVAINHLTVDHDAGTDAGTQGNHDEVLHTTGSTVGHFTYSSGVGIVGERHGDAVHLLGEHLGELHSCMTPFEVGCALYAAGIVVAVRGAYADTANAAFCLGLGDDPVEGLGQFCNKGSGFLVVVGADNRLSEHGATGIYDAAFGGLSTYINTNY